MTLVDSDPQGSSRNWAAVNPDQPLKVVRLDDHNAIEKRVQKLGSAGLVVIDGAPQLADMALATIRAADLVVIPVQPSPLEVWAAADLVKLSKMRIENTGGRFQAAFVISRVCVGTKIGREIFEIIAGYGLPVLKAFIRQRQLYVTAPRFGLTAMDLEPRSVAAREVKALADEILGMLNPAKEVTT